MPCHTKTPTRDELTIENGRLNIGTKCACFGKKDTKLTSEKRLPENASTTKKTKPRLTQDAKLTSKGIEKNTGFTWRGIFRKTKKESGSTATQTNGFRLPAPVEGARLNLMRFFLILTQSQTGKENGVGQDVLFVTGARNLSPVRTHNSTTSLLFATVESIRQLTSAFPAVSATTQKAEGAYQNGTAE